MHAPGDVRNLSLGACLPLLSCARRGALRDRLARWPAPHSRASALFVFQAASASNLAPRIHARPALGGNSKLSPAHLRPHPKAITLSGGGGGGARLAPGGERKEKNVANARRICRQTSCGRLPGERATWARQPLEHQLEMGNEIGSPLSSHVPAICARPRITRAQAQPSRAGRASERTAPAGRSCLSSPKAAAKSLALIQLASSAYCSVPGLQVGERTDRPRVGARMGARRAGLRLWRPSGTKGKS